MGILYLIEKINLSIKIKQLENSVTRKYNICAYQTQVEDSRGECFCGYSVGPDEAARDISIFESYERVVFSKFLKQTNDFDLTKSEIDTLINSGFEISLDDKDLRSSNINNNSEPSYNLYYNLNSNKSTAINKIVTVGSEIFNNQTTSGCSVHLDATNSLNNAILELLERDILLRNWLTGTKPSRYNIISDSPYNKTIQKCITENGYRSEIYIYNLANTIPVAISLIVNEKDEFPYIFVGTGSGITLEGAIDHALHESFFIWLFDTSLDHSEEISFADANHAKRYYFPEQGIQLYDFFKNCNQADISEHVARLPFKELIREYDFNVLPISLTVDQHRLPIFTKVYSPKAFPMYFEEMPKYVPSDFDLKTIINHLPHPF